MGKAGWIMFCALCAWAGTPRAAVADYPVRGAAARAGFGAEFMGRAIEDGKDAYFPGEYLVVDVGVFALTAEPVAVKLGDFRLRVNGSSFDLAPEAPEAVAAALRNPTVWERQRGIVGEGGLGQTGVVVGGQGGTRERFPGDPQARTPRQPDTGAEPVKTRTHEELAAEAALRLALGSVRAGRTGAGGLLYFHWTGKLKSVKRLELVYQGPAGPVTLKLR
jgi:hypothetical protein